jgi:hypothetical protein
LELALKAKLENKPVSKMLTINNDISGEEI